MASSEGSIVHHIALVLLVLCILASIGWCPHWVFFICLLYLYKVNERYSVRFKRRVQFEERKYANRKRLVLDSESVRWLNHMVERVWPICMEQIASQKFLLPIIPWFLDKYKPWTAKKAAVQHLYLGRTPPIFTDIRVVHEPDSDDHMILELGMRFLSAKDMIAVLVVQLRKRLGFGIRAKMHLKGIHVEGRILVGMKFIHCWPFIGRVRVSFVEPPYFQMTVKPIFHHGLDVTELPGIAGWLDKLLAVAFEQTLVEPNMLVVDVEKFASPTTERWFTMDEKYPIAFAKVEIIEAVDMKPSDTSGFVDPYVKGNLGPYRFTTKVRKRTSTPTWCEEFKIPITSWGAPNMLTIQVFHKAGIFDDKLGDCWININDLRGGLRHDEWLTLQHTKNGRLHLAITILEENDKDSNRSTSRHCDEPLRTTEATTTKSSTSSSKVQNVPKDLSSEIDGKMCHDFISTSLHPIEGFDQRQESKPQSEDSESSESEASACSEFSDKDRAVDGNPRAHGQSTIRRGLHNIRAKFHNHNDDEKQRKRTRFSDEAGPGRNRRGKIKVKAKAIVKKIGGSVDNLKDKMSRKGHGNIDEDWFSEIDEIDLGKEDAREKAKHLLKKQGHSVEDLKDKASRKSHVNANDDEDEMI